MAQEEPDDLGPVLKAFQDITIVYLDGRLSPEDMLTGLSTVTRHEADRNMADVFTGYVMVLSSLDEKPAIFGKVLDKFDGFLNHSIRKKPLEVFDCLCGLQANLDEVHPLYDYAYDKLAHLWNILSPVQQPTTFLTFSLGIRRGQLIPRRFDKPRDLGGLPFPEMN